MRALSILLLALASPVAGAQAASDATMPVPSPALVRLATQVLDEHPAVQAAEAGLEASRARGRAAGRPLYNPELELDAERAETDVITLGITQSIDWSGKRDARADRGAFLARSGQAGLAAIRQAIIVELLATLNTFHTSRETVQLANRRVELLEEFYHLARQRFDAGDIAKTDVDLARLALSEARMQSARLASASAAASAGLGALVSGRPAQWPVFPRLPARLEHVDAETLLAAHPRLRQLRAGADAARAAVTLAQRERRADPTVGVRGGKEESSGLIGLTLSVPLFVRNNFRAEVEAAGADALREEQAWRDAYRRALSALEAATARYRLTRAALSDWQRGGQASLRNQVELLKQLWEAGEISTTEYLVQLQQTLDTRTSAVELNGETRSAWVDWLDASGRAEAWLLGGAQ